MITDQSLFTVNKTEKYITSNVDNMEVYIPQRYEGYGLLSITEYVNTLGVFDIYVNGKFVGGLLLAAMIGMDPSEINFKNIDGKSYIIAKFNKGDKFIIKTGVVQNRKIAYHIFVEFLTLGNLPKMLTYNNMLTLFDIVGKTCSVSFNANHVVFEMMYAHLFRDKNDLTKQYRHTQRTEPAEFINLQSVTYATDSTSTKIIGPYINDGINSALVNQNTINSDLEDFMRS